MKKTSARQAYANYTATKTTIGKLNTANLNLQQRIYFEAKMQWREQELARMEMINAKLS